LAGLSGSDGGTANPDFFFLSLARHLSFWKTSLKTDILAQRFFPPEGKKQPPFFRGVGG
jgi:hypothetical protein